MHHNHHHSKDNHSTNNIQNEATLNHQKDPESLEYLLSETNHEFQHNLTDILNERKAYHELLRSKRRNRENEYEADNSIFKKSNKNSQSY